MSPNSVLLVTDFSDHARQAAERAAFVAEQTGAVLVLMHVTPEGKIEELRRWLGATRVDDAVFHEEARALLEQLADELGRSHVLTIRTMHTIGSVVEDILVAASNRDAGLVVLGARGAGSFQRLVLGTTSERLLNRAMGPLLVVRRTPSGPYRRVLVALDFSRWSQDLVGLGRQVAPTAELVLMHTIQVPLVHERLAQHVSADETARHCTAERVAATENIARIAAAAGLDAGAYETRIVEGDPARCILEQQRDCDVVVMGKQGRSSTKDLLMGSVSRHVLSESDCDVLISTACGSHESVM